NHVDTLHQKNLLHLGEDRYLTTLMLKHFPHYKLKFTPDALCQTAAPEKWSILLSQRRRWINSTIHNLWELILLPDLCGFCCFSMRFVVMFDLIGTVVMPAFLVYLGYLIYSIVEESKTNGGVSTNVVSLIILAAVYGLQALIFIIKRQWQHIGWMIIYLLATPIYSLFLPLYSFWHFDDFSWGNTRIVVEEAGKGSKKKKVVVVDEAGGQTVDRFRPRDVPLKTWEEYEKELWTKGAAPGMGMGPDNSGMAMSQGFGSATEREGSIYGGTGGPGSMSGMSQDPRMSGMGQDPRMSGMMQDSRMSGMGQMSGMNQNPRMSGMGSQFQDNRPMSMMSSGLGAVGPTDEELLVEIRSILASSDLMTITKKQVRERLSALYGVDLTPRKEYINNCIELILQDRL
ncbi:chitin synthase-domain-containing protein, partial [Piptocephalis cylindrospora]